MEGQKRSSSAHPTIDQGTAQPAPLSAMVSSGAVVLGVALRSSTALVVIGDCSNRQAGFSLMNRLAQVATGDCKDLLWTIVALKETDSEGFDRNVAFHCFG